MSDKRIANLGYVKVGDMSYEDTVLANVGDTRVATVGQILAQKNVGGEFPWQYRILTLHPRSNKINDTIYTGAPTGRGASAQLTYLGSSRYYCKFTDPFLALNGSGVYQMPYMVQGTPTAPSNFAPLNPNLKPVFYTTAVDEMQKTNQGFYFRYGYANGTQPVQDFTPPLDGAISVIAMAPPYITPQVSGVGETPDASAYSDFDVGTFGTNYIEKANGGLAGINIFHYPWFSTPARFTNNIVKDITNLDVFVSSDPSFVWPIDEFPRTPVTVVGRTGNSLYWAYHGFSSLYNGANPYGQDVNELFYGGGAGEHRLRNCSLDLRQYAGNNGTLTAELRGFAYYCTRASTGNNTVYPQSYSVEPVVLDITNLLGTTTAMSTELLGLLQQRHYQYDGGRTLVAGTDTTPPVFNVLGTMSINTLELATLRIYRKAI